MSSNTLLSYEDFCRKWSLLPTDISRNDYTNIRLAVRAYNKNLAKREGFNHIDESITISRITSQDNGKPIKGRIIREVMKKYVDPKLLSPLKEWTKDLEVTDVNWVSVFNSLHFNTCNNYKMIQFQYKLLTRISTCKYMRFKMGIEKDNPMCSMCKSHLETLPHIFLKCHHTLQFLIRLRTFIQLKIDPNFRDLKKVHFVTCDHENSIINYVNIAAKWYISKQFQTGELLAWDGFRRMVKMALNGEKAHIQAELRQGLSLGGDSV